MAGSSDKSENAFRTIGEAAEALGVAQHVLRFWETRFPQLQPLKRGGGRRYYRPADMALLESIRTMLHDEGLTIRGAQLALDQRQKTATPSTTKRAITEALADPVPSAPKIPLAAELAAPALSPASRATLMGIRDRLSQALAA